MAILLTQAQGERSLAAHNSGSVTVRRPTRHVSVKDVAAGSGVSFQTTSKVLNGGGSVSDTTRARILRVASDLGYVPNLQARSLVMQRTRTVGLITGDFRDPGLSRCLAGAEQEARRQGFALLITSIEPEGSGTEFALPAMMERRVDGILLAAPQMEDDRALSHVLDRTLPVVSLHHIASSALTTVGPDDEQAGYIAARHLLGLGHTAIGVVTGVRGTRQTQRRLRGCRRALDEVGIELAHELVAEGGGDVAGGLAALPALLARRPDLSAVVCHHDLTAIGALIALRKAGRAVPGACSVVGCDDLDAAAYTSPPLTTVHIPFYETGAEAMRLLLGMVTSGSAAAKKVVLPVHLITRASTAMASTPDGSAPRRRQGA
jgi:LacI family transcriptional regulator